MKFTLEIEREAASLPLISLRAFHHVPNFRLQPTRKTARVWVAIVGVGVPLLRSPEPMCSACRDKRNQVTSVPIR